MRTHLSNRCRVHHCSKPSASRFSSYCHQHKSIHRRQGAPDQIAITVTELRPFRDRVLARIASNETSPLWAHLEDRWTTIVSEAKTDAKRSVGNRYQRSAAYEFINISMDCDPRQIIVTTLAMFVLWHDMPWRFRSDAAFRIQLARRVRALSGRHSGQVYDHRTGKQKRIYREMTPKAGNIIGQKLSSAFGATGFQLALLDKRAREDALKAQDAIATALKELQ